VVSDSPVIEPDAELFAFKLAERIQKFERRYGKLSPRQKRFLADRLRRKLKKLKTQEESK